MLLVAVAAVALAVLGVWSFTSPQTQPTSAGRAAAASSSAQATLSSAPGTESLPPLDTGNGVASTSSAPPAPIRLPVTVLNSTSVTGLAAKIATQLNGQGWTTAGVGAYKGGDVSATTVYYTDGNADQQQSAQQLVELFPGKVNGPAPRFFDLPAGTPDGLVVVATGDWQP
jgi:hypothetical protein